MDLGNHIPAYFGVISGNIECTTFCQKNYKIKGYVMVHAQFLIEIK